jgi:quercetin dioxygenase-like cupin family protein
MQVWIAMLAGINAIGLSFYLIPRDGPIGAAIAMAITWTVTCVHCMIAGRHAYPVPFPVAGSIRVGICCAIMTAVVIQLPNSGWTGLFLRAGFGAAAYALAAIAVNLLDSREHAIGFVKSTARWGAAFRRALTTTKDAGTNEILDVVGLRVQFLTALSDADDDFCLFRGTVPAGGVVPIHSHAERETFYVLEGEIQGLWEDRWITLVPGDVFDVPGGLKHAWRNVSGAPVSLVCVTPMRLGRFFRDAGRPVATVRPGAPEPAESRRLLDVSRAYGYWVGGLADNAAVGISFG